MWGRGQRNKVMKHGEGARRVRCLWALKVLATPLPKGCLDEYSCSLRSLISSLSELICKNNLTTK